MKKYIIASVLSVLFLTVSCSKEAVSLSEDFVVSTDDEINYFIWKGLNLYYLWQEDVPTLADSRFSNLEELYTFFRGNESPEATFNSLLSAPGTTDRFSWIVEEAPVGSLGTDLNNKHRFAKVCCWPIVTYIFISSVARETKFFDKYLRIKF